jgi:hypothetical protein
MSSQGEHDFDQFLRRLLQEEANALEPADDGLERIRARLTTPRPAPVAWVMAVFSGAWRRAQGTAVSASAWLRTPRSWHGGRLRGWLGGGPQKWRSPVVLTAAALVAAAASVLAFTPLPGQAVSRTAALFRSFDGAHGHGAAGQGGGHAEGGGGAAPAPSTSPSSSGKQAHRSPSASPGPSAAASTTPRSGSVGSSPAASASPTPSTSSSPCPSPAASPSPSASPSPGSGACPTPTTNPSTGPTTGPTVGSTPNPAL